MGRGMRVTAVQEQETDSQQGSAKTEKTTMPSSQTSNSHCQIMNFTSQLSKREKSEDASVALARDKTQLQAMNDNGRQGRTMRKVRRKVVENG